MKAAGRKENEKIKGQSMEFHGFFSESAVTDSDEPNARGTEISDSRVTGQDEDEDQDEEQDEDENKEGSKSES